MTGNQFLAITPEGNFNLSSLEFVTAPDNTVVVRIIDSNRLLAVRVDVDLLKDQVAQLRSRPSGNRTQRARVLFSPIPADAPADETPGAAATAAGAVHDSAGGTPAGTEETPAPSVPAARSTDRPLPAAVTGPEAASSPSATPRTEPARVTPLSVRSNSHRQQRYDHPTGQRWSPA